MRKLLASPRAVLHERARMMREEEVPVGHLRLMKNVSGKNRWQREQSLGQTWQPLLELVRKHPLSSALTWSMDESGRPIPEIALEDSKEGEIVLMSKPPIRYVEEDGRLHFTGGPACEWEDGLKVYCLRGVIIPDNLYKRWFKGNLGAVELLQHQNQAIMSVLLEQMELSSLLDAPGVKVELLDHDERWGTLRTFTWKNDAQRWQDPSMTIVEVMNRSPEPDGSFRHYWLRVDQDCRPIFKDKLGDPQQKTALNAVASTFGMTGFEYAEGLEDES